MPKNLKARLRSSQLRERAERMRSRAEAAKDDEDRVFLTGLAEDMMRMSLDAEASEDRQKPSA